MPLRLTRIQRINNVASSMVDGYNQVAAQFRHILTNGLDIPSEKNLPALKATGEEVKTALSDNAKIIETVNSFILDGKSNDVTRVVKAERRQRPKKTK